MSERTTHAVASVETELIWLERNGYLVEDARNAFQVTCPCGKHVRWVHPVPQIPAYGARLHEWFVSQSCGGGEGAEVTGQSGMIFLSKHHPGTERRRAQDAGRMMWGLVVLERSRDAAIHSAAVAIDLVEGTAEFELFAEAPTASERNEVVYRALERTGWFWPANADDKKRPAQPEG